MFGASYFLLLFLFRADQSNGTRSCECSEMNEISLYVSPSTSLSSNFAIQLISLAPFSAPNKPSLAPTPLSLYATPSLTFSLFRLRPLFTVAASLSHASPTAASLRGFATRQMTSSLKDSSPNWSNRPSKETNLLDGFNFEHWLVVMEKPEGEPTRDDIIDSYVKTLAQVVGRFVVLSCFGFDFEWIMTRKEKGIRVLFGFQLLIARWTSGLNDERNISKIMFDFIWPWVLNRCLLQFYPYYDINQG